MFFDIANIVSSDPKVLSISPNSGLNKVLSAEIAAWKAYEKVSMRPNPEVDLGILNSIKAFHLESLKYWEKEILKIDLKERNSNQQWNSIIEDFYSSTITYGRESLRSSLLKAEKNMLKNYKQILKTKTFGPRRLNKIEKNVFKMESNHIPALKRL